MPNKNDKSDLVQFFAAIAAIVFCFVWLARFGFALAAKNYGDDIRQFDAKISNYVCEKWNRAFNYSGVRKK